MNDWPADVERVAVFLRERAVDSRVEEFASGTPTAEAAARAAGCEPEQIVKSLLFVCDERPVLVLVPGDRRADSGKIAAAAQAQSVRVAKRDEVVQVTGVEPGGVAPLPPPDDARVLLERELLRQDVVWVGGGSPRHMVRIAAADLARLTAAEVTDLVET